VEPRGVAAGWLKLAVPIASVLAALILGGVFLAITGNDVAEVYTKMLDTAFGSWRGFSETLVSATPLILTGLAAAIAFKMLVWNIGGEGQLLVGAVAASGIAIMMGDTFPAVVAVILVISAGAVGGAIWAGIAAAPRVYLGTNEIITTLMLNFIAINLMNYLVFGSFSPWRDPDATQFPQGRPISDSARLPEIGELIPGLKSVFNRLDVGFFIAVAVAVFFWLLLFRTPWGFGYRVAGDSAGAARYAGVKVSRTFFATFLMSGAAAGLAGGIMVAGVLGKMDPRSLELGLGFTGIIVAALARLNPIAVIPVAILLGALINSGPALQSIGVPSATAVMLQGAILIFAVAGEFLITHRIRRPKVSAVDESGAEAVTA
jgi:simple sugar transport system permease protein